MTKYKFILLSLLMLTGMISCKDDISLPDSYRPEGEDAVVSLKIDTRAFMQLTRAEMGEGLANRINNIWVGIYNVKTGERTGTYYMTEENPDVADHNNRTIPAFDTKSGTSYIVAVANVVGNKGVDLTSDDKTEKELKTLLESADSWSKFRAIAIKQNFDEEAVIQVPVTPLDQGIVMTGSYLAQDNHGFDPDMPEEVYIAPGKNEFSGKIHLRRLWTQNTINIEPTENVIDLEVLDIQVVNVPEYSWLQSRDPEADAGKDNILGYANAGDAQNPDGAAINNPNYMKSLVHTTTDMTVNKITVGNRETTRYTFSYWQFENKRTGIINDTQTNPYQEREREYKTVTGDGTGAGQSLNTGIYKSLSPQNGNLNNNATYLKIRASITYRNPQGLENPPELENVPEPDKLPGSAASRTAICTYTVHLGFLNGIANDFNCLRNSKYTYNIKIRSVKDVLIEAYREGELQPGAEGIVTDVTNRLEELDAHSGVFNIYLTTDELKSFSFSMTTYYGGVAKRIAMDKDGNWTRPESDKNRQPEIGDDDFKFYNWIELVPAGKLDGSEDTDKLPLDPTKIPTTIKEFPNLVTGTRTGNVYYLGELRAAANRENNALTGQWFTVYVNEYTYEKRYDELEDKSDWGNEKSGNPEWKKYVMQPQRQAWFNVSQSTSADNNSSYYKSKYALTQRSIQTYYDYQDAELTSAVGAEHVNESFGMNLRWTVNVPGFNQDKIETLYNFLDQNNGRYNTWIMSAYASTGSQTSPSDIAWPLNLASLQNVNKIDNENQDLSGVATAERIYSVPKLNEIPINNSSNGGYNISDWATSNSQWWWGTATDYDPQVNGSDIQYIQVYHACMNRNRDENGNGRLDPQELKWYVPTSGKYVRLILGRNVLPTPIMNYARTSVPEFCGKGGNTYYHFATSDNSIVWSEEGTSLSFFNQQANEYSRSPWQVRCIRNLGTDLRSITRGDDGVVMAYDDTEKDTSTHGGVVKTKYYSGQAVRTPQIDPLPVHKTNSPLNKLGTYGFEIAPRGNTFSNSAGSHDKEAGLGVRWSGSNDASSLTSGNYDIYKKLVEDNTLCSGLNTTGRTGWRVPNQKEITIMRRMGILDGGNFLTSTQEYYSAIAENGIYPGSDTPGYQYRIASVEDTRTVVSFLPKVNRVRCVRDLTAAEAKMKYTNIINYKQP